MPLPCETRPDTRKATAPVTVVNSPIINDRSVRESVRLTQIQKVYGDKVRIVYRRFSTAEPCGSVQGGEAAHCAGDQGKHWEMHDAMFVDIRKLPCRR